MADISDHLHINHETTDFPLRHWELVWYSLILCIGVSGNILVCLVMYKSSSLFRSNPFNMYLCSLATADALLALVALPCYVLSTPIFKHPSGVSGDIMCKTITGDFLTFYLSAASEYSLILISLERLRALHKPLVIINSSSSKRRAWLSIVTAWFIPLVFQSPKVAHILEYKRSARPVVGSHCTFAWGRNATLPAKIYGGIILAFEGLIPLTIFIYSFSNIRKCLLKEERRVNGDVNGNTDNNNHRYNYCRQMVERRKKTVQILMIVTVVFTICWIPNKIMFFMINFMGEKHAKLPGHEITWNSPVYQIGILIGFTGSCINPFLFAWQSREFRKHSKRTLKSLLPECLFDVTNEDFQYKRFQNQNQTQRKKNIAASTKATKQANIQHNSQVDPTAATVESKPDTGRAQTSGTKTPVYPV